MITRCGLHKFVECILDVVLEIVLNKGHFLYYMKLFFTKMPVLPLSSCMLMVILAFIFFSVPNRVEAQVTNVNVNWQGEIAWQKYNSQDTVTVFMGDFTPWVYFQVTDSSAVAFIMLRTKTFSKTVPSTNINMKGNNEVVLQSGPFLADDFVQIEVFNYFGTLVQKIDSRYPFL